VLGVEALHSGSEIVVKPIGPDVNLEDLNSVVTPQSLDLLLRILVVTMFLAMTCSPLPVDIPMYLVEEVGIEAIAHDVYSNCPMILTLKCLLEKHHALFPSFHLGSVNK